MWWLEWVFIACGLLFSATLAVLCLMSEERAGRTASALLEQQGRLHALRERRAVLMAKRAEVVGPIADEFDHMVRSSGGGWNPPEEL